MKVLIPSRILDKHVGGNTTYARELTARLTKLDYEIGRIPAGRHPAETMFLETLAAVRKPLADQVLHYVADTGPLLPTRSPSVVTVHGIASRWIDNGRSHIEERIWRHRVQAAIKNTDELITVSHSSAKDIEAVFDLRDKLVHVIPHGINFSRFSSKTPLPEELQYLQRDGFVLYIGNIEPRKNLKALVQAFNSKAVKQLGLRLVIAGRFAWNYEEVKLLIESSPSVIHLGFVSDEVRSSLMQHCSLFVFPSLYEGFGFPVLEALAAGAVVACSSRGSLEEVAGPSIRFESLDPNGLSIGIQEALTNGHLRSTCQLAGRSWAETFSWSKSAASHGEVYKSAMIKNEDR